MLFASDHPVADKIMGHVLHRQMRFGESLTLPGVEEPYSFEDKEGWYEAL